MSEFPIVKDVTEIGSAFTEGVGVSTFTAAANLGMSALGAFLDPIAWLVGQIMEPIYNWIIENVAFVKETLNMLLGDPAAITAVGECTSQHGAFVKEQGEISRGHAAQVAEAWQGLAGQATAVTLQAWGLTQQALGVILEGCGMGVKAVASVVDMVKQFIIGLGKQLMNDLISKAVMSALASFVTFGAAYAAYTAWAAGKVAAVAAKIAGLLRRLAQWGARNTTQCQKLSQALQRAANALEGMQNRFLAQVHQADQAAGAAAQAQHSAGQAQGAQQAANHAGSDGPGYQSIADQHRQDAINHTNTSNRTRPDVIPDSVEVGVGAANDAATNDE